MPEISMKQMIRLASLVAHVQEIDLSKPSAAQFDLDAAKALANDEEVVAWMATIDPVYLPERRSNG